MRDDAEDVTVPEELEVTLRLRDGVALPVGLGLPVRDPVGLRDVLPEAEEEEEGVAVRTGGPEREGLGVRELDRVATAIREDEPVREGDPEDDPLREEVTVPDGVRLHRVEALAVGVVRRLAVARGVAVTLTEPREVHVDVGLPEELLDGAPVLVKVDEAVELRVCVVLRVGVLEPLEVLEDVVDAVCVEVPERVRVDLEE